MADQVTKSNENAMATMVGKPKLKAFAIASLGLQHNIPRKRNPTRGSRCSLPMSTMKEAIDRVACTGTHRTLVCMVADVPRDALRANFSESESES